MARVTQSSGATFTDLPEHEPITVVLKECVTGASKFNPDRRVAALIWEAVSHGEDGARPRVWESPTISVNDGPDGPSKLKRIINAALGRDKSEPVVWVDDETLKFGLDDGDAVAGQIAVGLRLVVRGELRADKDDPTKQYFRIRSYAPAPAATNGGGAQPVAARPSPGTPRGRAAADFVTFADLTV